MSNGHPLYNLIIIPQFLRNLERTIERYPAVLKPLIQLLSLEIVLLHVRLHLHKRSKSCHLHFPGRAFAFDKANRHSTLTTPRGMI